MAALSIGGDGAEWSVFRHFTQDRRPVIVRSRLTDPAVWDFAVTNFLAQVRCTLAEEQINSAGMPDSTEDLDAFEDQLLAELERMQARTYEIAAVTGAGRRDFFFAASEGDELLAALRNLSSDRSFKLQLSRIEGSQERLLRTLIPHV